jgi:hypothetical protein
VLADTSRALAEASQEERTVTDLLARRIAESLGDLCAIWLLSDDREWVRGDRL